MNYDNEPKSKEYIRDQKFKKETIVRLCDLGVSEDRVSELIQDDYAVTRHYRKKVG